jgi:hypothetical protein
MMEFAQGVRWQRNTTARLTGTLGIRPYYGSWNLIGGMMATIALFLLAGVRIAITRHILLPKNWT